jgi:hypothetical protein
MVLSPQYTPFNSDEISFVIKVSHFEREYAEQVGLLERNIHFEDRYSRATAMYSMVDAVKFDSARRLGWPAIDGGSLTPYLDSGLDILCDIHNDHPQSKVMLDRNLLYKMLIDVRLQRFHLSEHPEFSSGLKIQEALATSWAEAWLGFSGILRLESVQAERDNIVSADKHPKNLNTLLTNLSERRPTAKTEWALP